MPDIPAPPAGSEGSGWTTETLREYLLAVLAELDKRYEQRFTDQGKAVDAALVSAEKAVNKAESASEKRFDGVNEFRQTLSDQAATFISRSEVESRFASVDEKVAENTLRVRGIEAKAQGLNAGWIYLGQLAAIVAAVTAIGLAIGR